MLTHASGIPLTLLSSTVVLMSVSLSLGDLLLSLCFIIIPGVVGGVPLLDILPRDDEALEPVRDGVGVLWLPEDVGAGAIAVLQGLQ